MGIVASGQRHLCNVDCAHPQFSPRAFQTHPTDIAGNILADTGCEYAMKVGHRETSDCRQHIPIEGFVNVFANVPLDIVDTFEMALKSLWVSQHEWIIAYQNTCSLL